MVALWLDNRPNFSGIAQWLDEDDFESDDGGGAGKDSLCPEMPDEIEAELEPRYADAASPEFARVWQPLTGSGREPRPGLLVSVVRAGNGGPARGSLCIKVGIYGVSHLLHQPRNRHIRGYAASDRLGSAVATSLARLE